MIRVEFEFSGIDELAERLADTSPVMAEIGEFAQRRLEMGFDSEQDPYRRAWAQLAASTVTQKSQSGAIMKILQHRGDMRASLNYEAGSDQVQIGYNMPYAEYHQTGTSRMPQRQVIPGDGLPEEWRSPIEEIIADWVNSAT